MSSGRATKRSRLSQDLSSVTMDPAQWQLPSHPQQLPSPAGSLPPPIQLSHYAALRSASTPPIYHESIYFHAARPNFEDEYTTHRDSPPHHISRVTPPDQSIGMDQQRASDTTRDTHSPDRTADKTRPTPETPAAGFFTEGAYPYSSAFDTDEYPWEFFSNVGDICDFSECAAKTCNTCENTCGNTCDSCEQSCYLPCNNPDHCSSKSCLDETCFDQSCLDSEELPDTDDSTPIDDQMALLDQCEWVGNGENCTAVMHSSVEKFEHVTESHIKPQSQITCEWDSCGQPTDVNRLPDHLRFDHHHEPAYPCLWHGCDLSFGSDVKLDAHIKAAHLYLNCHWAGCEWTAASPQELQIHFSEAHFHLDASDEYEPGTNQMPITTRSQKHLTSQFHHYHAPPKEPKSPFSQSPLLTPSPERSPDKVYSTTIRHTPIEEPALRPDHPQVLGGDAEVTGPKTCMWQIDQDGNTRQCGLKFKDGNQLQDHIRLDHIRDLKPENLRCRWPGCNYKQSAKDKSKLNRHTYTHSNFCYGACSVCKQVFSEKSKLRQHEATHLDEKPFPCKKCQRRFPTQNALTNHERTHRGDKPLICGAIVNGEKCPYRCSDPSNMSTHKKKHSPPKFRCKICDRAFCRNDTLKRHMITHNVKRPAYGQRDAAQSNAPVITAPS